MDNAFKKVKAQVEIEYASISWIYEDIHLIEVSDTEYKKQLVVKEVQDLSNTYRAGVRDDWIICSINYTSDWGVARPEALLSKFNPPYVLGFSSPSVIIENNMMQSK